MLETGRPEFGSFADYDGPEAGRLVVSIGRADEKVYFGLAPEYQDDGTPFTRFSFSQYRFRIRRATNTGFDPVVHGPFVIGNDNANVNSYEEAAFGVYDTTLTQFGRLIYVFEPGEAGDYYIEFDEFSNDGNRKVNIPFWDITVTRDGQPVVGRVWSKNWAFRTPEISGTNPPDCVWDRPFNGALYSYTEDGFVSRIDFNGAGMQGLSFNVAFNTSGPGTTGDLGQDRMSVAGENAILNAAEHRVFLSLPDIELFPDGICGEVTAAETFVCDGTAPYCLDVAVTRPGQVEVLLDFNGNGILDDTIDVSLVFEFSGSNLSTCIPWNGLRGDGSGVTFSDTVDVIITYAQGVQHWSAYDVEFMKQGFCVETVRPVCSQNQTSEFLYWDDRNIPGESGTGAPKDQRTGCSCFDGCRTWNNFSLNSAQCDDFDDEATDGYGDKNTLNTWWFANSESTFTARVPVVSAVIVGPNTICQGDTALFRAEDASLNGPESYAWSGPGVDGLITQEVNATMPGTYCVTIVDENGCSNTTCSDLTVIEVESDQFPESLSICFGESTSMVSPGIPEYQYLWSPNVGIDDVTSNQPTFFPSETTTYTVMVTRTNEFGQSCTIEEEITVEVTEDIALTVLGGGGICDPTTSIEVLTDVEAEVTLFGPGNVVVGTGNSFTLPVSGSTSYVLIATDLQGCMDTVTFNLEGGPTEISTPDTVLTCLSDGATLNVTNLDANDILTYSWSPANLFDPNSVNSANPVFAGSAGDYEVSVTATNQYGCATTETTRLIVIDDNASLSFTSEVDCNGSLISFTNTSTAGFGFIYDFGDGVTSTEENPSHTYDTPGTYTVTLDLIYDQDCISSFSQEVTTVETVVAADFDFSLGDCLEAGATISFTDNSINNSGLPLNYAWSFTGANPTSSTESSPSIIVPSSGVVTVSLTVTTVDDCSSTIDTSFTVNLATGNLSDEIIICPGDTAALNPSGDPSLTYNWAPSPDFEADEVNPRTAVPGTYLVTITDANADLSCVTVDTVTVIQPDPIGLEINGPNGPLIGGGTIELPSLTFCGVAGDVTVDISTADDVEVTFADLGGTVLGTGTTLTVNPVENDTIVVTATNMFGCFERDTVVLRNQSTSVDINVEGNRIILCEPGDTSVTITNLNADDVLSYVWQPNSIITSALDGAVVDITTTEAGTEILSVLVTNQFGCDTTVQVEVITLEKIVLEISGPNGVLPDGGLELPTLAFCGEPAELTVDIVSGSNVDIIYEDLAGNVLGTGPSITLNPTGSDTLVVVADGELGCGTRDTIVIENQNLSVDINVEGNRIILCEPGDTSVTITNLNADDVLSYVWQPNSIITSALDGAVVDITTTEAGTEILSVLVTNQFGCDSTVQVEVITLEKIVLEISGPNGVLPDGGLELPTLAFCGEPAELTVDIVSGSNVDIIYEDLAGNVLGTGPSITLNPTGSDTLVVVADGELGCGTRDTIVIENQNLSVDINVEGNRIILCEPGDTSVTITNLNADDVLSYVWQPNSIITSALDGAVVDITTTEAGTEILSVLVANQFGCDSTVQVEVITLEKIVLEISGPNGVLPDGGLELPTLAFCGEPAELTVDIVSGSNVDIIYEDLAGNVLGTGPSITLNPTGSDTLVVVADGELGCGTRDTIVIENQNLSVDINVEGNRIILCEPGDTSVTITNLNADDVLSYVWQPNSIITSALDGAVVDITTTEAGTEILSVLVTNQFGCDSTVQVEVITLEKIVLEISGPNGVLPDGGLELPTLAFCGEPAELTVDIVSGSNVDIIYEDLAGNVLGTGPSITLNPTGSDTLVVVADGELGCGTRDTIVIENQNLSVDINVEGNRIILCEPGDTSVTITNLNADDVLSYVWQPNSIITSALDGAVVDITTTEAGTEILSVLVTNQFGCDSTVQVEVITLEKIVLEISGPNGVLPDGGLELPTLAFCGEPAELTVDIVSGSNVDIIYEDLAGNVLGTGPSITLNPTGSDTLVVVADGELGCGTRDTIVIENQNLSVDINVEGNRIILCEPGDTSVTITNLNADDVLSYVWQPNSIITSALDGAVVDITTTEAGTEILSVLVTNQFGCDSTVQVEVITLEKIVLEISGPNGVLPDGGLELPTLAFCGEPAELTVDIVSGSNVDIIYEDLAGNVLGTGPSITLNPTGSDTLVVVADGELGCGTRDTIVIENQNLSVDINVEGNRIILCEPGDTSVTITNLNAGDVLSYVWQPNSIITSALDGAVVDITTTEAGTEILSVLVTNQFGCDSTVQVEVITLEKIVLEISGPNGVLPDGGLELPTLAFCGEPAELTVDIVSGSNVDIIYEDLAGNVLGTGPSITLNPTGSDTLVVVADGELGCGTRDTIVIENQNLSVDINVEGGRIVLCEPGDTSITITNLNADDVLTYVWQPNDIITSGLDAATVDITTTEPSVEILSVLVTNQFGCDTTIQVEVITLEGIVLDISGPNGPLPDGGLEIPTLYFCGEPADLSVEIMAGGSVDITYTDVDGNVLGTGNTLTLNPTGRDTIIIIAGGQLDCGLVDTIVVENTPISVEITIDDDEIILCEPGDTAVGISNLTLGDTLTYEWEDNPIITSPLDGPSVDITTTEPGSEVLSVLVTNQFGCDTTVNVTVTTLEPIGLVVNGPDGPIVGDSLTTCGEPVDLTVDLRVEEGITVTFTDPAGNVLGMGNVLTLDPELQDTVIITAENEFACTEIDTVIIINQQVNAELSVAGMELSLCEASDTIIGVVNLDIRDELTYRWADNDIISGPLDGPTVTITTPQEASTELSVLVTNQFGCDTTLSLTVATIPFMPNRYPSPYQVCYGDLVTIAGGPRVEGYLYEWTPADGLDLSDPANPMAEFTEDVTLTVLITDPATGCSLEQVIEVVVAPEISLMASPADTTLCAPGAVGVTASSVNDSIVYTWYSDESLTDAIAEGPDYTIFGGVPGETYVVYVRGVDPNTGCEQSIPVTVRISELTAGFPDEVVAACAGEPTSIFTQNSPLATLQYTYEPAGIIDASNPANPTFTGDESTVVNVTVTDPATGCDTTLMVTINVTNLFLLEGVANPPEIFTGQSSELSVEGDCDSCTYTWFPPTGIVEPETGRVVTATPDEAGEWIYEVEVESNGCMEVVEVLLIVEDPICDTERIYIPNAFTPNGDNRNDVLRVRSKFAEEISEFTLIIYNRWGQEVYKSNDIFESWDGTAEGDPLEPDVYGYWLRVRCPFGEELIQQGNITLMR
jgi:gliding motility-associated-like protein